MLGIQGSPAVIFRSPWPDIELPSGSLCDTLLGAAGQFGDKAAVIEGETGRTLTYLQLIQRTEQVAAGLACAGLKPGYPVALALPNSIDFVLGWYGTLLAGGWVVPIPPMHTPDEMEFQIRDSGARFLITIPERAAAMENIVENIFVTGGNWNDLLECNAPRPDVRPKPHDLAALPYSSGTTGKPKGVMLTHLNIVANMRQLRARDWARCEDVIVNMFPLYHVAGLNAVLNAFLDVGATVVLMRRFDLEIYLALSERYCATQMICPPPVILAITKSTLWDKFRLESLKRAGCGAAPLGAELQEAFEQRTGLVLAQGWGMTEATVAISITPNDRARRKFGSCGYLVPSCQAQVVDVTSQKPLGVRETGEIWIRGPHIMKGYWNQPDATSDTLVGDGWMRTGDIGYFDSDDCVYLVDRLKELIKYKALQVAPAELEGIIQSHAAVRDAAVIGVPDPSAGEIPVAFVVRRDGAALEAQELMDYVAARVARYKRIRAVEFVDEIPKSPAGKILRRVLKERVRAQRPNPE
jgi:acyl-CoA synthetase (AMP-forming)/AMP-acid ligase II